MSFFQQIVIVKMWLLEALEAKIEFNLEMYRNQRSFWTMTQPWWFETRKFDSWTKPSSGRIFEAPWDQTTIGMTSCDIKVTFENTKLVGARFGLGQYSLVMLAKHVNCIAFMIVWTTYILSIGVFLLELDFKKCISN